MIKVKTSTSELTFDSWKSHLLSPVHHNCPHLSYHWLYQKSVLLLTFSHFTDHLPTPFSLPFFSLPPFSLSSDILCTNRSELTNPFFPWALSFQTSLTWTPLTTLLCVFHSSALLRLATMLSTNRPHIYSHLSLQTSQHLHSRRETSPSWSQRYPQEWKHRRHWIVCSCIEYLTKWRCFAIFGCTTLRMETVGMSGVFLLTLEWKIRTSMSVSSR